MAACPRAHSLRRPSGRYLMERHGSDAKESTPWSAPSRCSVLSTRWESARSRCTSSRNRPASRQEHHSAARGFAGALRLSEARRRWALSARAGVRALAAAHGYAGNQGELLQRAVTFLAHASGETASFYVREGNARVCVIRENSTHAVRHHVELGQRLPLKLGAASLALLAFSGVKGARFDEIRRTGYAVSIGERLPDAAAVSAPVFSTRRTDCSAP